MTDTAFTVALRTVPDGFGLGQHGIMSIASVTRHNRAGFANVQLAFTYDWHGPAQL